ncbi:MAG: RNA 2',3'-cyclic phosphodiesterase [Oscillospiraceae bacterium]|nr:RNA 2',3'-cyclic phosphodiesterase [Oscillospiraceae bacterium]
MRLFIAVNFNNETRSRLLALRDELRGKSQRGNFSAPENLHLTLAFLGECDDKQTAAVKSVLDTVSFELFNITIDCVGRFKRDGGDIWWAGLHGSKPLLDLQRELTDKLNVAGFALEKREYKPHITLGREVVTDIKPWVIEPFNETIGTIDLMKSERINGKLTYTSIYRRGKWLSPIVVEPYNPQWAREFERIREYLASNLGYLAVAIHHVGSTSVTGLAAKPIIDIDIEIALYEVFPQVCEKLAVAGWRHDGDYGIAEREAFNPIKQFDFMRHHLYVCPSDSAEMIRHLKFRNYLRGDKAAADEYGKLKQQLAVKHGNDIDAYIDGKSEFIKRIIENKKKL